MIPDVCVSALKKALSCFATGVIVATTRDAQERPRGLTVTAFTSVSLEPPLVLVSISQSAKSHPVFLQAQGFCINILSASQKTIANCFATQNPDKFRSGTWGESFYRYPLLEGALAWIECKRWQCVPAGDHTLFLGRVVACQTCEEDALMYWRRTYGTFRSDLL